ncbi:MAG TPA: fatty acid--CoA ligase family protein, partial [Dehalococcoidia bacterium]|nr:fatty acid--CoA ligase family protein [Dehalococcoidia bacterium]
AGKVVLMETFDAEGALELIQRERVTYIVGFPVHVVRMMRHPSLARYDLRSLRLVHTVGAFLTATAEEVEERFGAPWVNGYGAVDGRANIYPSVDAPRDVRHRTVGSAASWDELRILDENKRPMPRGEVGEIHWRGASGAGGYYRDPELTRQAWGELGPEGFYNCKDLGRLDEDGNLILMGRREDIINRGGQNIYPTEVESLIGAHPKVQDTCVVAIPDPELGERACAFVVPREGEEITFQEMVDFLLERRIAKYKLPERLELRRELPLAGPGKVNRKALEQEIAQTLRDSEEV